MKFDELLKKYEEGTATPEERQQVEAEIEKVRLIEEHLALQEEEVPLLLEPETAREEVKTVRKQVKRNTRRTALAVVAAVLVVLALLQWVVFPFVNARVYDHGEEYETAGGELSEYKMFMDVFTQLHMPLYRYVGTYKENTGFGQWTLYNEFWDQQGQHMQSTFQLNCGLLETKSQEFGSFFPAVNLFTQPLEEAGIQLEGTGETVHPTIWDRALEKMDDSIRVTAVVRFKEPMTISELLDFREKWGGDHILSAALLHYGGRPMFLRMEGAAIGWTERVNEDYPCLNLHSLRETERALSEAELYQQHLESQLQYIVDHPYLAKKFTEGQQVQYVLSDVRENGARFSGVWYEGTAQELLQLYDSGVVELIWPQEAHIAFYD